MTWTLQGNPAFQARASFAGYLPVIDLAPNQTFAPGMIGIVRLTAYHSGAGTGPTNNFTGITDTKLHTWVKLYEESLPAGMGDGECASLWIARLENGLDNTDLLSASQGADISGNSRISLVAYDIGGLDFTYEVKGAIGAHGTGTAPSVTLSLGSPADAIWLGVGMFFTGVTLVTGDADFAFDQNLYGNTQEGLWGQYRLANQAGDTWACTLDASAQWCAILAAVEIVSGSPPPPVALGPREFQEDFATLTHVNDRTSTTRRPDAVSLDYLTAYAMGPVDLGDDSEGHQARRWYVRAEVIAGDPSVLITRADAGNTAWEAEDLLFQYAGLPIVEASLAFSEDGWPVVACERPTGPGGSAEVWIYYRRLSLAPPFDPEFVFENMGAGRTPRVVLDRFPYVGTHCPPDVDVQLCYLKPGEGVKRREQRERFETEHDTALTDDTNLFLELFVPMESLRVLRLWYVRRNPITGRYTPPLWLDSVPYQNHLLDRPDFNPQITNDLASLFGEPWRDPSGSTTTTAFTMNLTAPEDVDSIELQGADSLPAGLQPDSGGIWSTAATASGPVAAGASHGFSVSVDHGLGTMSPNVFRARTKRTISGVDCYSPWRYWFAALEGIPAAYDVVETLVNCERDAVVCHDLPGTFVYQSAFDDHGPNLGDGCAETPVTNAAACGGAGFFAGGWQPFPPLWRRDWAVQVRSVQPVNFSDPDGTYAFGLVGRAFKSWSSGSGITLPDPAQDPQQVP
jgi:hypothetical protein